MTVTMVWLLDLLHGAMICLANWMYLIAYFGDPEASKRILWPVSVTIALTATVTFLVHIFFTHRVYQLSRQRWWVAGPIGCLAVLRVVSAISCTVQMVRAGTWEKFADGSAWLFTTGLSISAVLDFLIALALIVYLQKSRTGWQAMDQVIDAIVLYTVENGLLTSIFAVLSLIFWCTMRHNLIFLAMHFAISKLYANSFLATLNARKTLQQRSHSSGSTGQHQLPVMFPTGILGRGRFSTAPAAPVDAIGSKMQITIEKTVHCMTDVEEEPTRFSESSRGERTQDNAAKR